MDIDADRPALEAWLVLLRAAGLGPAALRTLHQRHGSAPAALAAARRGDGGGRPLDGPSRDWLRAPARDRLDADLAWLAAPGHALLTFDAADFPPLPLEAPSPPAALFVDGNPATLWLPQVAIVGSRNASHGGLAHATTFARALGEAGFAITSGLAEGIDGAAHAAALDAGSDTVAVLGTGPDLVYPASHAGLARRVAQGGALVSEFPPGTAPHPTHFPRRNRIIAGLALGTLVVEASLRSGSLITARDAAEAGREVFAIPGSIRNPLARGCHQLIRTGARLVESAAEIIDELAPLAQRLGLRLRERLADAGAAADASPPSPPADPDQARLLAALDEDPVGIDELATRSGFGVARLASLLLLLELDGAVVSTPGGAWARRMRP